MRNLLILLATVGVGATACAQSPTNSAAPDVPSNPPYIVLSANLDEPSGHGFCIDTYGAGQTDLLHTHTCKPVRTGPAGEEPNNNDTRFAYREQTQQIESFAFEGYCMQALIATDWTVFALLECGDHPRQKFTYAAADQSLRLAEDQRRCVTVASETVPAGPWVKRALQLETCDGAEPERKQWTIVTE